MNHKSIKEMYECNYIPEQDLLYPLQKWYNKLLDKTIDELTIADILRIIRQKEFIDIAISKAVEILISNPFAGELYEGELLEKISQLEKGKLKKYITLLENINSNALIQNEKHEWLTEKEKKDYVQLIISFKNKLSE